MARYLDPSLSVFITVTVILMINDHTGDCSWMDKSPKSGSHERQIGFAAPLMGEEIDLETIEGMDQLTKLVLLKTDSLPDESDRLDARYLTSLMETLYTGLRKPFKSVSADILGIFPTLDFLNISCDATAKNGSEDLRGQMVKRRHAGDRETQSSGEASIRDDAFNNDSMLIDGESGGQYSNYKSSIHVCKAVTNDCLSINDLVQILPPSITTSNSLLVRLCPVILFRLVSNICRHDKESSSAYHTAKSQQQLRQEQEQQRQQQQQQQQQLEYQEMAKEHQRTNSEAPISLSTLQILRNLKSSDESNSNKRPQKLHKKLRTQTSYKNTGHINTGSSKQPGVDEQLLKIRLKLSEPSIEKVWLFSLLFVILSIVVSMGGLIVLPFVKKTTRRRILTLFEGLAVGGLTGSATLHMFPQAFGLVDENYHRYFWRIVVVFLGIYLCYLCERTIKILKVVRAKMRRRSQASLIDMDFRYNLHSINRELVSRGSGRVSEQDADMAHGDVYRSERKRSDSRWAKRKIDSSGAPESHGLYMSIRSVDKRRRKAHEHEGRKGAPDEDYGGRAADERKQQKEKKKSKSGMARGRIIEDELHSNRNASDLEATIDPSKSMASTRQRLIRCLKSVRSQFSPVYAVFNQPTNEYDTRIPGGKSKKARDLHMRASEQIWHQSRKHYSPRRDRLAEDGRKYLYDKPQDGSRSSSTKRQAKHKEIETMLYHRNLIEQQKCRDTSGPNEQYPQRRFSDVNDLVDERQDQDNPARMSVDTVSWMILFGDGLLNVIDGLSIGAAFERNILAGISISVAVMLEEVTHRLGTTAILIRTGMSIKQSFLCTFLSACALFPGMIIGIMLSDATDEATPYIFCAAGGIFLYTGLVDVMKEMNRSIENAMRKDIRTTLKIFALQNVGIILAVIFLSFLALYEPDFEEYQKILNNN